MSARPPGCITLSSPLLTKHGGQQPAQWGLGSRSRRGIFTSPRAAYLHLHSASHHHEIADRRRRRFLDHVYVVTRDLFMICLTAVNEAFRISWKLWHRIIKSIGLNCTSNNYQVLCVSLLSAVSLVVSSLPSLIMTMKTSKELSSEMLSVFLRHCLVVINTRARVISPNQLSSHRKKCLKNNAGSEKNPRRSIIWLTGFLQLSRQRQRGWQCEDLIYIRDLIKSP